MLSFWLRPHNTIYLKEKTNKKGIVKDSLKNNKSDNQAEEERF